MAAELESDPRLKSIPIAFISGLIGEDEIEEGRETDVRGRRFIPKSIQPTDLVAIVRTLIPMDK